MLALRTAALVAAAAVLLGLPGCGLLGGDDDASPPVEQTATTVPNPEVLDVGSPPLRDLRLQFTEGATTTVELSLDLDLTQEPGPDEVAIDSPTIIETVAFTVDAVDGEGATVSFVFTGAEVERTGTDLTEAEFLTLSAEMQPLVGLGGTGRVSDRGTFRSFTYDVPDDLDETIAATLESFEGQLDTLAVPFPSQPLGVGAQWQTVSTSRLNGLELRQVATYEITGLTDTGITYRVSSSQTGAPQQIDPATLPEGTEARLISANVSGTSKGTMDLTSLVATSTSTLSGTQVVEITVGEAAPQELTQRLDIDLTVAPPR